MSDDPITLQVRALESLGLQELRAEWRRRLGPPPRLRSPEVLRRVLAWRIQVDAWGGLDEVTRRKLRETSSAAREPKLSPGSQVTREWEGVVHAVQVLDGGFLYAGATYPSLSAVARVITGVRWNGPRFFGLRKGAGA